MRSRLADWRWPHRPILRLITVVAVVLTCVPLSIQVLGLGYIGPYPLFPVLPVVVALAALAASGDARSVLMATAACNGLIVLAALVALILLAEPAAGLLPIAIAAGALGVRRFPVAGLLGVAAISGVYGTMAAYVPAIKHGALVDFLLISLWLAAFASLSRERDRRRLWIWPGVAIIAAYIAYTIGAGLFAPDSGAALRSLRSSTWYSMAFLLVAYAPWPPGGLRRFSKGLVAIAFFVGAYATLRWQIGPSQKETILAVRSTYTNYVDGKLGVFGSFTSRKELAAWTALILPFLTAYALGTRGPWRLIATAAAVLCGIGVFASDVRTGLVAAAAGVVVVGVLVQMSRGIPGARLGVALAALLAIGAVGLGAFSLTTGGDQASTNRLSNIFSPSKDLSVQGRVYKWRSAVQEIDRKPLGYGVGSAGIAQEREARFSNLASLDLDNGYLKVAYEEGFFGAVMFVLALAALLAGLVLRVLGADTTEGAVFGSAACGALVGLLVLMTAGIYQEGLPALAGWLVVGLGAAQFSRQPAGVQEPSPEPRSFLPERDGPLPAA